MAQQPLQNQDAAPIAANLGLARPPIIYLTAIVAGLVLHFVWPIPFVSGLAMVGVLIAVFAATLFIWSIRTFHSAGTPVPGNRPTTTIVTVGPYRFSRNPIYLAFSLFQTGVALGVNDAWFLVTLIPAVSVMLFVVIQREEGYLEARFGEEYSRTSQASDAGCRLKTLRMSLKRGARLTMPGISPQIDQNYRVLGANWTLGTGVNPFSETKDSQPVPDCP
jgi:protein-S-isoprenylcysteine O-methyltransferase Ste14